MGGKIEKSHGSAAPGPRDGAEAGERSEATNGGRSGAPRVRQGAEKFENRSLISHKVSIYSAK